MSDAIKPKPISVDIDVDTEQLDIAIEKANHLVELLTEASDLISSLAYGRQLQNLLRDEITGDPVGVIPCLGKLEGGC